MDIKAISSLDSVGSLSANKNSDSSAAGGVSFGDFLNNALNEVNNSQKTAELAQEQLATGEINDVHSVMIAAEKANLALELTVQVRNKVLDAYQEIMRMQM